MYFFIIQSYSLGCQQKNVSSIPGPAHFVFVSDPNYDIIIFLSDEFVSRWIPEIYF